MKVEMSTYTKPCLPLYNKHIIDSAEDKLEYLLLPTSWKEEKYQGEKYVSLVATHNEATLLVNDGN
jgi:hypothetical protein